MISVSNTSSCSLSSSIIECIAVGFKLAINSNNYTNNATCKRVVLRNLYTCVRLKCSIFLHHRGVSEEWHGLQTPLPRKFPLLTG